MNLQEAQDILAQVGEGRARWGKHYFADDIGMEKVLDALQVLNEKGAKVQGKELAKANRQAAAYKAQAAKAQKAVKRLREELDGLTNTASS